MFEVSPRDPATFAGVALGLSVAACDSPQNTFEPRSDAADSILTIYIVVVTAASLVGAAILIAMVWLIIKYRARPGRAALQIHGNTKLEIAWIIGPILVLLIITFPTMFWVAPRNHRKRKERIGKATRRRSILIPGEIR